MEGILTEEKQMEYIASRKRQAELASESIPKKQPPPVPPKPPKTNLLRNRPPPEENIGAKRVAYSSSPTPPPVAGKNRQMIDASKNVKYRREQELLQKYPLPEEPKTFLLPGESQPLTNVDHEKITPLPHEDVIMTTDDKHGTRFVDSVTGATTTIPQMQSEMNVNMETLNNNKKEYDTLPVEVKQVVDNVAAKTVSQETLLTNATDPSKVATGISTNIGKIPSSMIDSTLVPTPVVAPGEMGVMKADNEIASKLQTLPPDEPITSIPQAPVEKMTEKVTSFLTAPKLKLPPPPPSEQSIAHKVVYEAAQPSSEPMKPKKQPTLINTQKQQTQDVAQQKMELEIKKYKDKEKFEREKWERKLQDEAAKKEEEREAKRQKEFEKERKNHVEAVTKLQTTINNQDELHLKLLKQNQDYEKSLRDVQFKYDDMARKHEEDIMKLSKEKEETAMKHLQELEKQKTDILKTKETESGQTEREMMKQNTDLQKDLNATERRLQELNQEMALKGQESEHVKEIKKWMWTQRWKRSFF